MDKNIVVPALLFLCLTYAFKLLLDARMRYLLFKAGSAETVSALIAGEQALRRQSQLQGGLMALGLGLGLAVVAAAGWPPLTAGTLSVLLGSLGIAKLAAYWLDRSAKPLSG
jgi:hypothetical protein